MTRAGWLLVLAVVAGCGGGPRSGESERAFANALRIARLDFARGRYDSAAASFALAEEAAWRLDDPAAIAAAGSERALSLLLADQPAAAREVALRLQAELARRTVLAPGLLGLVEAGAELGLGDLTGAEQALAAPLADADPAVRARATYLQGLAAARRRDAAGVAAAAKQLDVFAGPGAAADREELEARLDLLEGRPDVAWPRFAALAETRRGLDDPDGVGDALALAGEAAAAAGEPAIAADLLLRSARNAQVRGRTALAQARLATTAGLDDGTLAREIAALQERLPRG